ncbi:MAG: DNA recombination protein RmuC [Candidatus Pacebacteria bacterium]|jgi:DNA recombination protein RmuC|nr:DNA recombination protein RmuC [Candidatus Paceibacterota bacterium]|tara:strand:- start:13229 stop:14281 length:1053 start_codon:yes stop_codon:yes gene_type:complete
MNISVLAIIIASVSIVSLVGIIIWLALRGRGGDQSSLLIQNQIQELTRMLDNKLGETTKQMHESVKTQLGESSKIVREVTEGLTKLDETNKQVVSFADQLQSLQDVLQNPKQRGVLGEYLLETVLKNVLPPGRFQMQYQFKNGDIVDAVVFLEKDKILPIDSKFSLENYNKIIETQDRAEKERLEKLFKQDLKNRIDETAKYIRPREGTMDFAFMFIPSEGIYYDLLINQVGAVKTATRDLIEYAFQQKKVIIVSPTSFMAYLQTVLQGLKSLQIEQQAQNIKKWVHELERHLNVYGEYHIKLGNSIATVVNHHNASSKEFNKIDKDIFRITGETTGVEPPMLEKPDREE